jgi:hypothetical protein
MASWATPMMCRSDATGTSTAGEFFDHSDHVDHRSPRPQGRHSFDTSDGLTLVGEVAWPESHPPMATALFLHPLPTAGGLWIPT